MSIILAEFNSILLILTQISVNTLIWFQSSISGCKMIAMTGIPPIYLHT